MICAGIYFQLYTNSFYMFPVISYCKEREILFKVESNISTLKTGVCKSVAIFLKQ